MASVAATVGTQASAGFQASGSRPFQDSSEPRISEKLATWIKHLGLPRVSDRDRPHVLMFSAAGLMFRNIDGTVARWVFLETVSRNMKTCFPRQAAYPHVLIG